MNFGDIEFEDEDNAGRLTPKVEEKRRSEDSEKDDDIDVTPRTGVSKTKDKGKRKDPQKNQVKKAGKVDGLSIQLQHSLLYTDLKSCCFHSV